MRDLTPSLSVGRRRRRRHLRLRLHTMDAVEECTFRPDDGARLECERGRGRSLVSPGIPYARDVSSPGCFFFTRVLTLWCLSVTLSYNIFRTALSLSLSPTHPPFYCISHTHTLLSRSLFLIICLMFSHSLLSSLYLSKYIVYTTHSYTFFHFFVPPFYRYHRTVERGKGAKSVRLSGAAKTEKSLKFEEKNIRKKP